MTIEHLEREIQKKSKNLKDTGGEVERLQKEHRNAQRECEKFKDIISNLPYNDQTEAELIRVIYLTWSKRYDTLFVLLCQLTPQFIFGYRVEKLKKMLSTR